MYILVVLYAHLNQISFFELKHLRGKMLNLYDIVAYRIQIGNGHSDSGSGMCVIFRILLICCQSYQNLQQLLE